MRKTSANNRKFEETIRERIRSGFYRPGTTLPSTRELAEDFELSSSTVYRILLRLTRDNVLTQHGNGRFFLPDETSGSNPTQPFACLLPKVRLWSLALQEIMEGVTQRSAHYDRGILLFHNDELIKQSGINTPPSYADEATQTRILEDFYRTQAQGCEGVILDNIWRDDVIERFRSKRKRIVIVNRTTKLSFASTVHVDFDHCSALALAHLLARGYETLYFLSSYEDNFVAQLRESFVATAAQVGAPIDNEHLLFAPNDASRHKIVEKLKKAPGRIGIFMPEDNWAKVFLNEMNASGVECPKKMGVFSATGTPIAKTIGLSSLHIDFGKMGRRAVDVLMSEEIAQKTIKPEMVQRQTT